MDRDATAARLNSWFDSEFEIHGLIIEAGHCGEYTDRISAEIKSMFAPRDAFEGDLAWGPLDPVSPPPTVGFQAKARRRLGKRRLFKIETYSAPGVGGLLRAYTSENRKKSAGTVWLALDVADFEGEPRIITVHRICGNCSGTGVRDGEACTFVNFGGEECKGGLNPQGGRKTDAGARLGSARFEDPDERWLPLMER